VYSLSSCIYSTDSQVYNNIIAKLSSVSIVTGYGQYNWNLICSRDLSFSCQVHTGPEAFPASFPMCSKGSFHGDKVESDHPPPSNAKINVWNYMSAPQNMFIT
jgi:hypothetical protein